MQRCVMCPRTRYDVERDAPRRCVRLKGGLHLDGPPGGLTDGRADEGDAIWRMAGKEVVPGRPIPHLAVTLGYHVMHCKELAPNPVLQCEAG